MPTKRNGLSPTLYALTATLLSTTAFATNFDVPSGSLEAALDVYSRQSGIQLMVPSDLVRSVHTGGVKGDLPATDALSRILSGTGFSARRDSSGVMGIVREVRSQNIIQPMQLAQAAPSRAAVETVTVTSSKLGGADVQSIPIAITALSQEQLTARQVAGGPDLVKEVPNLTFSKTNFTGYNIQIRGIGTQAISVTTDPAVAVAFNDIPFIRNHFFEQEFYDVGQAEVLRGPQGTLYGRNATAGVVNIISAKPTDQFEAMASADIGNYKNRRFEGMLNLPILDDRLDLRVAGEWTKRDGYSFDTLTDTPVDGRDLWSTRVTLGWKPVESLQVYAVWEHFQENDNRMRTAKQLCATDPEAPSVTAADGTIVPVPAPTLSSPWNAVVNFGALTQGCKMTSLYSKSAFGLPDIGALPYIPVLQLGARDTGGDGISPYAGSTQSTNLRDIVAAITPVYKAKNDTIELNAEYKIAPALTFTSQTGYDNDFLWSTEDYNRFNSVPGVFQSFGPSDNVVTNPFAIFTNPSNGETDYAGTFCDPQLGCSDRIVAQDLSEEHAWQMSQEFRLASNFSGPLNFSIGGNFLHYETDENYYVFINSLTLFITGWFSNGGSGQLYGVHTNGWTPGPLLWTPGVSDNSQCILNYPQYVDLNGLNSHNAVTGCSAIDPNPISSLSGEGHNYFRSDNPYVLNSYAGFGEAYYNITDDLKLTAGLRWTDDQKHFTEIPSELLISGYGYPSTGVINQEWNQWTGRFVANWTPKFDFTDQSVVYGSYSRGYKAGGANPPGAELLTYATGDVPNPIHPLTFKPEFIDAYELGTKNTALDGAITINGDVFFYNYTGYQISEIVDRTAINLNFNATVKGAELETTWEAAPGLKFSFAGGYEDTRIKNGQSAVDLMDRTAGRPGWLVIKPFPTQTSNCIMPEYVIALAVQTVTYGNIVNACETAYSEHHDPITCSTYVLNPDPAAGNIPPGGACPTADGSGSNLSPGQYAGFDPLSVDPNAPANVNNGLGLPGNNGEGFDKNVGGNELPNAPHFTVSMSADYSMPITPDWAGTFHVDYYWQDYSWARVFNDNPYDRLRGYTNVNLALILTDQNGWQVMGYVKNVFDVTDITGDFLNSDDSGLTTNVFLTDPRLFGVRVTKNW